MLAGFYGERETMATVEFPQCPVCLDAIALYVLPNCGHTLCGCCICGNHVHNCPICRTKMSAKPIMIQGIQHNLPDATIHSNNARMEHIWAPIQAPAPQPTPAPAPAYAIVRQPPIRDSYLNSFTYANTEFKTHNFPREKWSELTVPSNPLFNVLPDVATLDTTLMGMQLLRMVYGTPNIWMNPFVTPIVMEVKNCTIFMPQGPKGLSNRWYMTITDDVRMRVESIVIENTFGRNIMQNEYRVRAQFSTIPTLAVHSHGTHDLLADTAQSAKAINAHSVVIGCRGIWQHELTMGSRWHILKIVI